jgi:outer membrane protein W
MKTRYVVCVMAVLSGLSLTWSAHAGQLFLPVGLSYSYGSQQLTDKLADFYRSDGYSVDQTSVPIGLSLNPFYEWDNGLGVGVSVGPLAFLTVDVDTYSGSSSTDTDKLSYVVPVGGFVRYTLFRHKTFSPYVRVGVRYPFAGGDNLESSTVGPFGMVGVDIWRNQKVGLSVEVGYDASHVNVKYTTGTGNTLSDKVPYSGFTATLSVLF